MKEIKPKIVEAWECQGCERVTNKTVRGVERVVEIKGLRSRVIIRGTALVGDSAECAGLCERCFQMAVNSIAMPHINQAGEMSVLRRFGFVPERVFNKR